WLRPDADDDEVARDRPTTLGEDAFHPLGALETLDRVAEERLHAVVAMDLLHHPPDRRAEDAEQRGLEDLDDRDLDPECAQGGGDLGADEPHADDDRAMRAPGSLADRVGIGDPPELQDAVQLRAAHVE